jgi:hypothetical protein
MSDDKLKKAIIDWRKTTDGTTVKIHGKPYSLVSTRLTVARRNLGSSLDLKSTLLFHDKERVIVQVDAFIDNKHVSTGLAEEYRNVNRINQLSAIEVAETSACGRCLAFLSFCDDNIASAEEVSGAVVAGSSQLNKALTELAKVSHLGSYRSWLTDNQKLMKEVKDTNPLAYSQFLLKFNQIKNKLETNGVKTNG